KVGEGDTQSALRTSAARDAHGDARSRRGSDGTEKAVSLGIKPRGEVQGHRQAPFAPVAKGQIPKAVVTLQQGVATAVGEGAEIRAAHWVKGVDLGGDVAEIADKQIAAELAKAVRSQGDSPRRGEFAARGELLDEVTARIEHRDGPGPFGGHLPGGRRA